MRRGDETIDVTYLPRNKRMLEAYRPAHQAVERWQRRCPIRPRSTQTRGRSGHVASGANLGVAYANRRDPLSEVRAKLAAPLEVDFGGEIAQKLNLESLADRDEAWRRLRAPQSWELSR